VQAAADTVGFVNNNNNNNELKTDIKSTWRLYRALFHDHKNHVFAFNVSLIFIRFRTSLLIVDFFSIICYFFWFGPNQINIWWRRKKSFKKNFEARPM
jgi:hypothetical protein